MHKRKDEIRDIYQGGDRDFDKDFTPQVAQEQIEIRQRDLRRSRIISIFFGVVVVALAAFLISMVSRDFLPAQTLENKTPSAEVPKTARYSLTADALYVMDDPQAAEPVDSGEKPGPKPLSAKWVKNAAYHIIMGQQALSLNQPEEALNDFQQVIDIYPDILGLRQAVGSLRLQQKDFAEAATNLEKALQEEDTFDLVNSLGSAYIGLKKYDQAEKYLKKALEMQPENPGCHKSLAELYRKMDRDNDAVYHFEKYIDLQPNDLDTMQAYALYLTQINRLKEAASFLTKLTQEVTDVAPLYFLLAQVQIQNGQQEKAMAALKSGVQLIDPELAVTWLRRDSFKALRESGEFKALLASLEKSVHTQ